MTRVEVEEDLHPGEVRRVYLTFGQPDIVGPLLQPGTSIYYGAVRPVGRGEIVELYFSDEERRGDGLSVDDRIAAWDERSRIAIENMRKSLDALLEQRIGLTEGVREVLHWANDVRRLEGALLTPFRAVDSETNRFPAGEVRKHWHEDRLVALDAERRVLEEHYEPWIMTTAKRLRKTLGPSDA
ncbi:hypothetical protein [Luteibacter rhizovicinus]|nr:hypothetical protein [Luteibacter rhizovicinus]